MHVHWLRLFVVFQEIQCLLNFHYVVGRQGIEIYPCIKFCLSHLSVVYMHIHMPLRMYWPRLLFQEIQCLHNFNHDDVRHVTEL